MSVKDYLKFFSLDLSDEMEIDYIINFINGRPDINDYEDLKKIAKWNEYGDNGYRIWCKLSKEKLEEFICEEIGVNKDDFKVIRTAEFAGI